MFSETTDKPLPCAICLQAIEPDNQNLCSCGDVICESCPAFGCSCVDDDRTIRELRSELRKAAVELSELQGEAGMIGISALSVNQRARLTLLQDVIPSLRNEVNRLDEIRHGEEYPDNES